MMNSKEIPPEAILLGVYLELQNGQWAAASPVTPVVTCFSPDALFWLGWFVTLVFHISKRRIGFANSGNRLSCCVCEGILNLILECYVWSSGNTQLALQIIKRNQLLPTTQQRVSPDFRKKPIQPLQLPSSFTQIQRKWATSPIPDHTSWPNLDIYEAVWTEGTFDTICVGVKWPRERPLLFSLYEEFVCEEWK